jgi:hypothetical protein
MCIIGIVYFAMGMVQAAMVNNIVSLILYVIMGTVLSTIYDGTKQQ